MPATSLQVPGTPVGPRSEVAAFHFPAEKPSAASGLTTDSLPLPAAQQEPIQMPMIPSGLQKEVLVTQRTGFHTALPLSRTDSPAARLQMSLLTRHTHHLVLPALRSPLQETQSEGF